MNWLIVPSSRLSELDALNTPFQICGTVETQDGTLLTGADKIGDTLWAKWQPFLLSLEVFQGEPVWKEEEEPADDATQP